jgi:uncharacterized protein
VHDIDKCRRRVSLSMIPPGTERTPPKHARRKGDRRGKDAPAPAGGAATPTEGQATAGQTAEATSEAVAAPAIERRPGPPPRRRDQRPSRPPSGGGQSGRGGQGGGGQGGQAGRPPKPKFKDRPSGGRKSAPLVPLSNEMKAGKAPLRTFGDLKQFFELKEDQPEQPQQADRADQTPSSDT